MQADRTRRLKRGGDKDFVHLDAEDAEKRYRLEPIDFLTAEKIFDARWAMTVLGEALKNSARSMPPGEKHPHSKRSKFSWITNNSITPPSYDEVASRTSGHDRRGQNTYPSAAKALHRTVARGGRPHGVRSGRN